MAHLKHPLQLCSGRALSLTNPATGVAIFSPLTLNFSLHTYLTQRHYTWRSFWGVSDTIALPLCISLRASEFACLFGFLFLFLKVDAFPSAWRLPHGWWECTSDRYIAYEAQIRERLARWGVTNFWWLSWQHDGQRWTRIFWLS